MNGKGIMTKSANFKVNKTQLVLAINCALAPFGVALVRMENGKEDVLIDQVINTQGSRMEELIVLLQEFCHSAHYSLSDVQCIGILTGPGSYTSMRLSLTVVKTLSQLYSIPIIGLSTLEHIVWRFRRNPGIYISVFHARADQHNTAVFGVQDSQIKRLTDDFLWNENEILSYLKKQNGDITCIGKLPDSIESQIDQFESVGYIPCDIIARYIAQQANQTGFSKTAQPVDIYYPTSV